MRRPTARLNDHTMATLRNGVIKSGLKCTESHDREFFIGRNPVKSAAGHASRIAAE
jgi:hypothetical protein